MQTINLQETTDIDDKLFEKGIRRMEILVKSMQKDIIEAMELDNLDLLNRVISRDEEINKLHRLVRRQMNRILLNANIPRYSKISISTLKQNFLISQNIERIGDQTVNIALLIKKYFTSAKNSKITSTIKEMSLLTISVLDQCVHSWKTQNITLANDVMDSIQKFISIYDSVLSVSNDVSQKEDHLLLYLLREEFKKAFFLALNIAEIVIDVIVLKT
ncbi:MAG: PhoU domain-containing protein, partial [Promethearchaeota archaeon]